MLATEKKNELGDLRAYLKTVRVYEKQCVKGGLEILKFLPINDVFVRPLCGCSLVPIKVSA